MKQILTLCSLVLSFLASRSQTETHNFITYDTMYVYHADAWHSFNYYLRISRPANLFKAGNPDTASRPAIITMPGVGEMGSDTTKLVAYGPHYWLNNGWDGSVVLGNGTHYPILVTIICNVNPPQPPVPGCLEVVNYLIAHYHINPRGVHVGGLSEGAFTWSGMVSFEFTRGDEAGMKPVTSMTLLSGAATSTGNYAIFGHWAKKYKGKAFLTVGYGDAQVTNPPLLEKGMSDSVKGSVYFTYNTVGSGSHCCWNTEYDPNLRSWQSFSPYGTYVTTNSDTNSRGTYVQGSSIFQWMLRQGDTTLVGSGAPAAPAAPVANAGTDQTITLPANSVTLSGSGSQTGGSISGYTWSYVSGPSTYSLSSTSAANPVVSNLTVGTYVFQLTATAANGAKATDQVTITVLAAANVSSSAPVTGYTVVPGTVQAENYTSMAGVNTQATTDAGGGLNVGWIDDGDWMAYHVTTAAAGSFTVDFRLATINSGAIFELLDSASGKVLTTVTVPNTGDWQTWTTVASTVSLTAGAQTLVLKSVASSEFNINWMEFATQATVTAPAGTKLIPGTIQAENYDYSLAVVPQATTDIGGGENVGWIYQGDWMQYTLFANSAGSYTVGFRVATPNSGASFSIQDGNGKTYGTVAVPNTGGWQTWVTASTTITLPAGLQSIRLTSTGFPLWNINWMQFGLSQAGAGDGATLATAEAGKSLTDSSSNGLVSTYLQLWPNPAKDNLMLDVSNGYRGKFQVQVLSVSAVILKVFQFNKDASEIQIGMSLGDLPAGVYFIHILAPGWQDSRKILKQ